MKWVLLYFGLLIGLSQLAGCNTPTKTMNLLTPDRLGIGKATGIMSMQGYSNGGYDGEWWGDNYGGGGHGGEYGDSWSDVRMDGTSESTMVWLEWDFPQWKESNDYDLYLRERLRTLNLEKELIKTELELELEKKNNPPEKVEDLDVKETEQYGTGGG